MPIKPQSYMLQCPQCRYRKMVQIKSDALDIEDIKAMSTQCSKCGGTMIKVSFSLFDMIMGYFRQKDKR